MPKCTECGGQFVPSDDELYPDEVEICYGCQSCDLSEINTREPDDNYDESDGEGDEDYWEEAAQECGLLPKHLGGGCTLGGTEHCDFECPFRDQPHLMTGDDEPDSS